MKKLDYLLLLCRRKIKSKSKKEMCLRIVDFLKLYFGKSNGKGEVWWLLVKLRQDD